MFDKNLKISVIIPAYNEEKNIINTINETKIELEILKYDYEIIVVYDGSTDKTFELVKNNYSFEKDKVKIVGYKTNSGKGNAIKYGTGFAKGDYILFMDADLDLHPRQLGRFLNEMTKTNTDIV